MHSLKIKNIKLIGLFICLLMMFLNFWGVLEFSWFAGSLIAFITLIYFNFRSNRDESD